MAQPANTTRTRGERYKSRGEKEFVGRKDEKQAFRQALSAVKSGSETRLDRAKTVFCVFGEGGMGKTWLLWAFERLCRQQDVHPVYIDAHPSGESYRVNSLFDLILVLRKQLGQLPEAKSVAAAPFSEFDKAYERFCGLDEKRRSAEGDRVPSFAANAIVDVAEAVVPFGKTVTSVIDKNTLTSALDSALNFAEQKTRGQREHFLTLFKKPEDVEFYLTINDALIGALASAAQALAGAHPLALMFDSYEYLLPFDREVRETLLHRFPEVIPLVFSGRIPFYFDWLASWSRDTVPLELKPFTLDECRDYFKRLRIRDAAIPAAVRKFTEGVPMAVGLAADIVKGSRRHDAVALFSNFDALPAHPAPLEERAARIIDRMADRFLSLVPARERQVVEACAVLGRVQRLALGHLLERDFSEDDFVALERYSFVRRVGPDLLFHPTVHSFILRSMALSRSDDLAALHRPAAAYVETQLAGSFPDPKSSLQDEKCRSLLVELAYHRMQASPSTALDILYAGLADGLWSEEPAYCLELLDMAARPVPVVLPSSDKWGEGCRALLDRKYTEAEQAFLALASQPFASPRFSQAVHDTLGAIYHPERLNRPSQALAHYRIALGHFRQFDEPDRIAATLWNMTVCFRALGEWPQAVHCLQEAYEIHVARGDTIRAASALGRLGDTYREWGKYAESVQALETSRAQYESLDRKSDVARLWNSLGITYREWGRYAQALTCYREAQTRFAALENNERVAHVLWWLGDTYREWGQYAESVQALETSRAQYESLDRKSDVAGLWDALGITYREWGRYAQALACYQEAQGRFAALDDKARVANMVYGIGLTYREWGQYAESVQALEESRAQYESLDRKDDVAGLWDALGDTYREWGRYEQALTCYQEAQGRFAALDDKARVANTVYGIGLTYRAWAKYAESVQALETSRGLYESLDRKDAVAGLWNHLGITYREWGRYEQALTCYREAQARFAALTNQERVANTVYGIGLTYRAWGKYAESVQALETSRGLYESLDRKDAVAGLWNHLGITYREWAKYAESVQALEESRAQYESLDRKDAVAGLWDALGDTYREWGRYAQALTCHREAQARFAALANQARVANMVYGIGLTYRAWGQYAESVQALETSRGLYESLDRKDDVAGLWNALGITYREWGRYEQALTCHREAQARFAALDEKEREADVLLGIGLCALETPDLELALQTFRSSLAIRQGLALRGPAVASARRVALALAHLEKFGEAWSVLANALSLASEGELSESLADAHQTGIIIAHHARDLKRAREHFLHARQGYAALGLLLDHADTALEMAMALSDGGAAAEAFDLFAASLQTYREFNRPRQIARALKELGHAQRRASLPVWRETLGECLSLLQSIHCDSEAAEVSALLAGPDPSADPAPA